MWIDVYYMQEYREARVESTTTLTLPREQQLEDQNMSAPRNILSVRETATRMHCTLKYVLDLVYTGKLSGAKKVWGRWQIPAKSVEAWLTRRQESRVPASLKVERRFATPGGAKK
jgi:hypothetical protein